MNAQPSPAPGPALFVEYGGRSWPVVVDPHGQHWAEIPGIGTFRGPDLGTVQAAVEKFFAELSARWSHRKREHVEGARAGLLRRLQEHRTNARGDAAKQAADADERAAALLSLLLVVLFDRPKAPPPRLRVAA